MFFKKTISLFIAITFLTSSVYPGYARAELILPAPSQFVPLSNTYSFPVLKGMKFDPVDPLKMEFIIDTADQKDISEEEASRLIRYFLAGLTIPEEDTWVNMSPYEANKIIPQSLSQTDLGKDLLSQDYILKQLSSSLTYPESDTGKDFWARTYQEVLKVAKTTKLPVNTFNKIWIMPDKAVVYEHDNFAMVSQATLKTMLEEDYLALKNNVSSIQKQKKMREGLINQVNEASSKVMRETILPKINADVNSGKNFATLRQIYYSLILGVWFKQKFKDSLYKAYINQGKVKGIDLADKGAKDKIYNLYVEAFKKGIYNYIKPEKDLGTGRNIKRQYFSGGFTALGVSSSAIINIAGSNEEVIGASNISGLAKRAVIKLGTDTKLPGAASPMTAKQIMQSRNLYGGNWKGRKDITTEAEARAKAKEFKDKFAGVKGLENAEIIIFPEAKWIPAIAEELDDTNIRVGVQSLFFGDPANSDDFTSEKLQVKINKAVKMGALYANVGHSMHRLKGKGLSDEQANKIMKAILKDGQIIPWYTIEVSGENDEETEIANGVNIGLAGITEEQLAGVPITPEPTALISTKGGTGTVEKGLTVDAGDTAKLSRMVSNALAKKYGHSVDINVGYGASVKGDNAEGIFGNREIRNALIGGASLKAEDFLATVVNGEKGKSAQKQASSALTGHEAIGYLITTRDFGYMAAVNSIGTARLVALPEKGKFAPGHDVFQAVKDNGQSVIAVNVVSYNQIEGHIRAAMEQNAILVLEVARSQLGYALNETKVVEYVKKAIEKIEKETGKRVPPIVVHGDHIQYTETSFKAKDILKAEYEKVNGEGSFKAVKDINDIDRAILENVRKKLVENTEGERKKVGEINERLIKAGFTSIAIDASTLWDEFAGDFVMDYYAKQGTAAQQLIVKLEKGFSLSVEWGSGLLKLDPATESGQAAYQIIKDELEANMMDRDRSRSEIDTMLAELDAVFGVLVKEARKNGLDPQEAIKAYDQISREVAEATIAGKLSDNVMATLTDNQKLLLLPSSNAQETALQLKKINELLSQYAPELVGHFGLEVEVGHVDRKYPNPKRLDKDGKPVMEARMTHPLAVRVMGEYLNKAHGLSFDLIATNNGSGHGTEFDKATLTPKSQVGKISPFLTRELQKEAASFGASIAQHGTSGSDMDELAVLSEAGVIKFNIATNYQQIILNVLALLDSGLTNEALEQQVTADQDALMSGLHKDTRAKILSMAKEIQNNPANAEVKDTDTLFTQFLKLTYQWGISKKKIKDTSTDKDIATIMAKEFKRVFGKMDAALMGLDMASASSAVSLADVKAVAAQTADSRGKATVEVTLILGDITVTGDVPAGASKGEDEAKTVSVERAIRNINEVIIPWIKGTGLDLTKNGANALIVIDKYLMSRINTLGANATVPVSRALWRMAAKLEDLTLAQYIAKYFPEAVADTKDPVYFYMNIFNGGLHALKEGEVLGEQRIDIQEIMIVPVGGKTYRQQLEMGDKIDFELKKLLSETFAADKITRADEAGFSVQGLGNSTQAIEYVVEAMKRAGYEPGKDVKLALDTAATSFYKDGKYLFQGKEASSDDMIAYYIELAKKYEGIFVSIEDGLAENDWEGWQKLTAEMKKLNVKTIGDDLFVTQLPRLTKGIVEKAATDILIKVNQNGTVFGTLEVIKAAKKTGMGWVVSHRSGETLDDSIADLALGTKAFGLKTGDPQPDYDFGKGGDYEGKPLVRRAKYLRMIELEEAATSSSSLITNGNPTRGGIDLGDIDVVASPSSSPVNLPMIDLKNFQGFTFRIIRIEPITNFNAIFGATFMKVEGKAGKENLQLAYAK